ncbi:MAG: methyltransferase domain-containing protein [Chloroflexota bacterium]
MAKKNNAKNFEWSKVDQAQDSARYVTYLDAVTDLDAVQAYKHRTYQAMQIEPGQRVLDVGCGTGDDVFNLAKIVGSDGEAVGIDNSETMILEAQKRAETTGLPATFKVCDIYQLDDADNVYDSCRSDRVFQHLAEPEKALAEMIRVCCSNGNIVIFDVDWQTLVVDSPDIALTRKVVNKISNERVNGWSGRGLFKLLRKAGLRNVTAVADSGVILSFAVADHGFGLTEIVKALSVSGEVSDDQANAWLDHLKQVDQEGHFFCSITGYIVSGQK